MEITETGHANRLPMLDQGRIVRISPRFEMLSFSGRYAKTPLLYSSRRQFPRRLINDDDVAGGEFEREYLPDIFIDAARQTEGGCLPRSARKRRKASLAFGARPICVYEARTTLTLKFWRIYQYSARLVAACK
jgi:hypothetical protein